jgi:hypothetical protein
VLAVIDEQLGDGKRVVELPVPDEVPGGDDRSPLPDVF